MVESERKTVEQSLTEGIKAGTDVSVSFLKHLKPVSEVVGKYALRRLHSKLRRK